MNIKGLIAATLITLGGIAVASPAKAETCFRFLGGHACNEYVSGTFSGQVYHLGFVGDEYKESFTIICDGKRFVEYESYGNMPKKVATYVARQFCALPN